MAQKWNLQDIVPPDRRKAPPPQREQRTDIVGARSRAEGPRAVPRAEPIPDRALPPQYAEAEVPQDQIDTAVMRLEIQDGKLARMRKYIIGGVALAVILGVGLTITIVLSGADVRLKPRTHSTTVQATFTGHLKPATGELGYELLTLEEEGERQVAASGKEDVKEPARGKIIVYNAYSATPQRLIRNTRFESPNGLIYRIADSIVIPGYKKDASGSPVPGSVTAEVFADSAGEAYNISDGRFTIPGLKGTDQYDRMYAMTAEGGITGGYEGTKFIIDETELAKTKQALHTELRDTLLSRITGERPNGFILFEPSYTFSYESLPAEEGGGGAAIIRERARLYVPLFREADFSAFIAANTVPNYDKAPVRIKDPKQLTFLYDLPVVGSIETAESIKFKLSGPLAIVWQIDHDKLAKELVGVSKSDAPQVFSKIFLYRESRNRRTASLEDIFPDDVESILITEDVP